MTVSKRLIGAAALLVIFGLVSACTGDEPEASLQTTPPQPLDSATTSEVSASGLMGRATNQWDCNAEYANGAPSKVGGTVLQYMLCRSDGHTPQGLRWKTRLNVTSANPGNLELLTRVLSRNDEKDSHPICGLMIPIDAPVLVQTTEGVWVVDLPSGPCGETQAQVRELLRSIGVRAN